jgi:SAM-dependent MidA family methyltransferase/NADH:ubiquinone oxidoreductase subunit 3 (subunit A)
MDTALYDPAEGYYARRAAIGDGGDFVTSPALSPLFARAVARVFAADAPELSGEIVFCEAAAGSGTFLHDFRSALDEIARAVSRRTRLAAIERSASGREAIRLGGHAEAVAEGPEAWNGPAFEGWVFSNELYDALPVHRVVSSGGRLFELRVTGESGAFAWTAAPAPAELGEYLSRFAIELAEGQVADVNLAAAPLHRALARLVSRGRLVAFDYGHRAKVLYHAAARPRGTLAVHSRGRRGGDPLERPGEVDLTAHVNWEDVERAGEAEGFATDRRMRQSEFLMRAGLFDDARRGGLRLEALRLFDPEGIGDDLSVLLQSKGIAPLVNSFTYFFILVFAILAAALPIGTIVVARLLQHGIPNPAKGEPYECGIESPTTAFDYRFSARYFLIAVLFVVFDVETIFLFPWAILLDKLALFGFVEMLVFLAILVVGYVYAWKRGALQWA